MNAILATLLTAATTLMPSTRGGWIEKHFGEGTERLRYRLFVPEAYDGSRRLPLLVMLHGCTQTAEDFATGTRLAEIAEREGLLLVFPEQRPDANPQRCWNWYDPAHQRRDAGEPARIAGIAREVLAGYAVDPDRVYLGGISAGGAMALNVAASYPELFAAVAVHSGVAYGVARDVPGALRVMKEGPAPGEADPRALREAMGAGARAVPLLVIHGAADPVVSPVNAEALAAQWSHAVDGAVVQRRLVEGLGHAWSGGSSEGSFTDPAGPDASGEMVRFFLQHPREFPGAGASPSGRN